MDDETMAKSLARAINAALAAAEERAKRVAASSRASGAEVKPPPEISIYDGVTPFQQEHDI